MNQPLLDLVPWRQELLSSSLRLFAKSSRSAIHRVERMGPMGERLQCLALFPSYAGGRLVVELDPPGAPYTWAHGDILPILASSGIEEPGRLDLAPPWTYWFLRAWVKTNPEVLARWVGNFEHRHSTPD